MNLYFAALIAYSALLVALGLLIARRVKRAADFFVAGRALGPGLLFSTLLAANIGAGSTVGASGLGYRFGLAAWWWVGSAAIGSAILAFTVGPRLWSLARRFELSTVGDFLERRYNRQVRGTLAGLLWLGSLAILAGQLIALAWILNVVAGWPKWQGCLVGGLVVVGYFAAGGLLSAAWVNLVQLVVMLVGLLLAVPFALAALGGWSAAAEQVGRHLPEAAQADSFLSISGIGAGGILGYVALLVPSFIVSPGLLQKIYGARDVQAVRIGVGLNALALALFAAVPALLGLLAFARYPALDNPELALPTVLKEMLPVWLGVLVLAAIFSAEVSTCDAILFMLSTSLGVDLYKTFLNPQASERRLLAVTRGSAVAAGLLGAALAMLLPSVISALTLFYGLLAAALFVPLVLGLYWPRMSARAALVSIVGAVGVTSVAALAGLPDGSLLNPYALGILAGLVLAVGVSWAAPERRSGASRA